MTVRELIDTGYFDVVNEGTDTETIVDDVFCCDLLSIAMGRGKEHAAWVTVMANVNTLAVLRLTEMSCIVLAEGVKMDETGLKKAAEEGVTVLSSADPVFACALRIHDLMRERD